MSRLFSDMLKSKPNSNSRIARNHVISLEMARFCSTFFQGVQESTILESCGIADLITTCYGGRNRRCGEEFAKLQSGHLNGRDMVTKNEMWNDIEVKLLNGQKLQGTYAAKEVYALLESRNMLSSFPLFRSIYEIAFVGRPVTSITEGIHAIETTLVSKL